MTWQKIMDKLNEIENTIYFTKELETDNTLPSWIFYYKIITEN